MMLTMACKCIMPPGWNGIQVCIVTCLSARESQGLDTQAMYPMRLSDVCVIFQLCYALSTARENLTV